MATEHYKKRKRFISVNEFREEKNLGEVSLGNSPRNETEISQCKSRWAERLVSAHPYELSEKERASLAEHVLTCSACAQRLADYQTLSACLHDLPNHEVHVQERELNFPPMIERMWQIQDHEEVVEKYKQIRDKRRRKRRGQAKLLAIAYIMVVVVMIIYKCSGNIAAFIIDLPAHAMNQIQNPSLGFMFGSLFATLAGPILARVLYTIKPLFTKQKLKCRKEMVNRMIDDSLTDVRR
jgi:hypothetical protein